MKWSGPAGPRGEKMIYSCGVYITSSRRTVNQVAPATQAGVYREGPFYYTLWLGNS